MRPIVREPEDKTGMSTGTKIVIVAVVCFFVLAAIAFSVYWFWWRKRTPPVPQEPSIPSVPSVPQAPPVPSVPPVPPVPPVPQPQQEPMLLYGRPMNQDLAHALVNRKWGPVLQ